MSANWKGRNKILSQLGMLLVSGYELIGAGKRREREPPLLLGRGVGLPVGGPQGEGLPVVKEMRGGTW
jgi:hypothetical protein